MNSYTEQLVNRIVSKLGLRPGDRNFNQLADTFRPLSDVTEVVHAFPLTAPTYQDANFLYSYEDKDGNTGWDVDAEDRRVRLGSGMACSLFIDAGVEVDGVRIDGDPYLMDVSFCLEGVEDPCDDVHLYEPGTFLDFTLPDPSLDQEFEPATLWHAGAPMHQLPELFIKDEKKWEERWNKAVGSASRRERISHKETWSLRASMVSNPDDFNHLKRVLGITVNPKGWLELPRPGVFTSAGYGSGVIYQGHVPALDLSHVRIVPSVAGYNYRERSFKWFGRTLKICGPDRQDKDAHQLTLSQLWDILSNDAIEILGHDALSTASTRPLARSYIDLTNREGKTSRQGMSVWPVTQRIGLAVAIPSSSDGRNVKRVYQYVDGRTTGLVSTSRTPIPPEALELVVSNKYGLLGWLGSGCPDPVLNLSASRIEKLRKKFFTSLLSEETVVFMVEGIKG